MVLAAQPVGAGSQQQRPATREDFDTWAAALTRRLLDHHDLKSTTNIILGGAIVTTCAPNPSPGGNEPITVTVRCMPKPTGEPWWFMQLKERAEGLAKVDTWEALYPATDTEQVAVSIANVVEVLQTLCVCMGFDHDDDGGGEAGTGRPDAPAVSLPEERGH